MSSDRSSRRNAIARRDAGLDAIRRATRVGVAGSVILAGAFAAAAAHALPGHGRAPAATPGVGSGGAPAGPAASSGIQAPAQAPAPTQAPPVASSGGS